jgi:probable HAF family extracellular repeat protein
LRRGITLIQKGAVFPALPTSYRVVDLGFAGELNSSTIRVNDINSATGAYQRADRATRAFLYTGATPPTDIGTLGGLSSFGTCLNNGNIVVGSAMDTSGATVAFVYNGTMTALDTPAGMNSRADGISDATSPLIAGALVDATGTLTATTWRNGTRTDLPKNGFARSSATGVNDFDHISGEVHNGASDFQAVLWHDDGLMTLLGFLPGGTMSFARGVNNSGQVVGFGNGNASSQEAFLWVPSGQSVASGNIHKLGTLGGSFSAAYDINSRGIVVGTSLNASGARRAFAWSPTQINGTNGNMIDLNTLLTVDSAGWVIEYATSINDGDVIVGWGRSPGGQPQRAILLQPG